MNGELLQGRKRKRKGWSQEQAALRLGVSQPYLSLLERGIRRTPLALARRAATAYDLTAAALSFDKRWEKVRLAEEDDLASELAFPGYLGLSYPKPRRGKKTPAEVLFPALFAGDMDSRLIEALEVPRDRLGVAHRSSSKSTTRRTGGYLTAITRGLDGRAREADKAALLRRCESELERSRFAREGTLCHDSLIEVEWYWRSRHHTAEARIWRRLPDLAVEHLTHAA